MIIPKPTSVYVGVKIRPKLHITVAVEGLPWWLRLGALNTEGPDFIPGQGTRSQRRQLRVLWLQPKIPRVQLRQVQPNK